MKSNSFSRIIKIVLYIVIVLFLNQIIQAVFPNLKEYPDVLLILPWSFSFLFGGHWYLLITVVLSILRDWIFSPLLGMSVLIGLITSFFANHFLQNVWQRKLIFLPAQVTIVYVIARILESVINMINLSIQFEIPFSFLRVFSFLDFSFITLIIMTACISFLIGYMMLKVIPYEEKERDVYAEDRLRSKESFK